MAAVWPPFSWQPSPHTCTQPSTVCMWPLHTPHHTESVFIGITLVKNNAEFLLVLSDKEGSQWESEEVPGAPGRRPAAPTGETLSVIPCWTPTSCLLHTPLLTPGDLCRSHCAFALHTKALVRNAAGCLPGHLLGFLPGSGHPDQVPQQGHPTFFNQQGAVLVSCKTEGQ